MADYRGILQFLANKNLVNFAGRIDCLVPRLVLFDTVGGEANMALRS